MITRVQGQAFERVYAEHAESLLRFLIFRTGDRVLAEDLLADTFERVLRTGRRFDPRKASEKTWLYAIALNSLRDHVRRRSAESRALERTRAGADETGSFDEHVDARDAVQRALASLTDEEREAIALRYGAELTVPEMAKLTKERLTTIEGRVYRALRKLRGQMEP